MAKKLNKIYYVEFKIDNPNIVRFGTYKYKNETHKLFNTQFVEFDIKDDLTIYSLRLPLRFTNTYWTPNGLTFKCWIGDVVEYAVFNNSTKEYENWKLNKLCKHCLFKLTTADDYNSKGDK